jgi:hypothetical protein
MVHFTAGDLVDGLAFLEPVERRAILFGMELALSCPAVITMTHADALKMRLTAIAESVVYRQPRHIRLAYLFWTELPGGVLAPLIDLEDRLRGAFGGMSWEDLRRSYQDMLWIDEGLDAEHFAAILRSAG